MRRTLTILALLYLLPGHSVAQSTGDTNQRFGVIESHAAPDMATELGVGWTRIQFQWAEIQAGGPDTWTPRVTDEQLDGEIAAGRMVVGLLIGIPDWARDQNRLPSGLWLPHDHPSNTWGRFVRQMVTHHGSSIQHWIIWNEPDIAESEIAHSWDGTVADFARLQKVAYLAAKDANNQAVIHLSAFTYWADHYAGTEQYMARLLDEIMEDPLAAQHNHYFDVASAHLYFQPNQIYDLLTLFTGIMRDRGLEHPIWLVETNAPPYDDPAWPVTDWTLAVTIYEQAAFIPQALASALAAGARRVAVYKLLDIEEDYRANPEPFGLVRMDRSRRPAFNTYQVAIRHLDGASAAVRERWNEVGQIRIDQAGQTTTVLFARLPFPQQAQVEATDSTALLVDMWGETQEIEPVEGFYQVELPPALCSQPIGDYCMIGGTTYYLVQAADAPDPTPAPTSTPKPSPTPTPSATPTETGSATRTPEATPMSAPPTSTPAYTIVAVESEATPAIAPTTASAPTTAGAPATSGATTPPSTAGWPLFAAAGLLLLVMAVAGGLYLLKRG